LYTDLGDRETRQDRRGMTARPLAIGCMRLSTEPDRDHGRALAVLHAAFDAGVALLDTADAYCWDDHEIGHNERLIAQALRSWRGDRSRITIATKGGMTRPDGRWEADGRAKHLTAACERSCRALDVNAIDLYQLHVIDPRTPLATSVRALAALHRNGVIKSIGLSNVTVGQIEEARRIVPVDAVQVELSVWYDGSILGGVVEYCVTNGIRLLAYRPLGGRKSLARIRNDDTLNAIAARRGATPFEIALAWLEDLNEVVIPIPGVTHVETVASIAQAHRIMLTEDDRELLDRQFPSGRAVRAGTRARPHPRSLRSDAEVVMVMGLPAAGKTTFTQTLVAQGYRRLNRDEAGGSLGSLIPELQRALASGARRVVLDNTYITRKSRAEVIGAAAGLDIAVRCKWLNTSLDDAQVNAATRLVTKYGTLPDEGELAALRKRDVNVFPPTVLFRYQRELEPPDVSEGFAAIEQVPFERQTSPGHVNSAAIVWCDDPEKLVSLAPLLRTYLDGSRQLFGLSWQPAIAEGTRSRADVEATFGAAAARMGLPIQFAFCPHGGGPPRCWCRKPLPGLGVLLIHRHQLDAAQCIYIGGGGQDPGFARKLGFAFRAAGALR
jgi:aryl-alcohol dehydrogenase-like predicted oxidoreductase